ncbi:MAG: AMP-binding protein [Hyalangium sp.]|uniref:AMP-binding protein n=1 Tax=Hyalangium sp. TaxID=2028555 RepID=UPI00389AC307
MAETVCELFLRAAERFPERIFLRVLTAAGEERLSYGEVARRVASSIGRLRQLGLHRRERVVSYSDETRRNILFYLACAFSGVQPIPLSPLFSASYLSQIARRVGASRAFCAAEAVPAVSGAGLRPLAFGIPGHAGPGECLDAPPEESLESSLCFLRECAEPIQGEDVFLILPTSGSTGEPKLVPRQHRTWLRDARQRSLDLRADEAPPQRFLMAPALLHSMGVHALCTGMLVAAELCIPTRLDTAMPIEELRRFQPTYLVMAPRVLRSLMAQYHRDPVGPPLGPSARVLLVGGAKPDPAMLRPIASSGVDVIEYYASSELSLVSITPRGQWREGHTGRVAGDVELRIAADGEVLVRSPAQMPGYLGQEVLTQAAYTEEGFFKTGDLGALAPDGWLRLHGRKRDVFNTPEGCNIYPVRIEEMLEGLPWVHQAMLVGDQRPYLSALVVVSDPIPVQEADGYLDPSEYPGLYLQVRAELASLNTGLETVEQIVRFALFAKPFCEAVLRPVGQGKVQRNRSQLQVSYATQINRLYSAWDRGDDPTLVPRMNAPEALAAAARLGGDPRDMEVGGGTSKALRNVPP